MPLKNLKCKNRLFAQEPLKCTNGHRRGSPSQVGSEMKWEKIPTRPTQTWPFVAGSISEDCIRRKRHKDEEVVVDIWTCSRAKRRTQTSPTILDATLSADRRTYVELTYKNYKDMCYV